MEEQITPQENSNEPQCKDENGALQDIASLRDNRNENEVNRITNYALACQGLIIANGLMDIDSNVSELELPDALDLVLASDKGDDAEQEFFKDHGDEILNKEDINYALDFLDSGFYLER